MLLIASSKEQEYRYNKCVDCEHNTKSAIERCKACGCLIKAKIKIGSSSCPWGKW